MMLYKRYIISLLCINFIIHANGATYGKTNLVTDPHIKIPNKHDNSSNIQTEGGPITVNKTIEHHESTSSNSTVSNVSSVNLNINKQPVVVNHGREGVYVPKPTLLPNNATGNTATIKMNSTTEKIIPVSEAEVTATTTKPIVVSLNVTKNTSSTTNKSSIEPTGDSKIKPRKGAPTDAPETSTKSTTVTTTTTKLTTTKPKKMKPTVTVGSDDEPYPPSNFVPHKKSENNSSDLKLKQSENFVGGKYFKKGPDYVLPIVLTILAVPLVAILLAVLYKRGSEWWHHRHYRRMDFLIDGMYNN